MEARPSLPGRGTLWAAGAAAALAAAAVLFRFDPMKVDFYPKCPLFVLTGLLCPGCGALRAGHALLHGDLGAALGFNALLTLALPLVLYALLQPLARSRGAPLPALRVSTGGAWALLGVLLAFGVVRNFPFAPFTLLAP